MGNVLHSIAQGIDTIDPIGKAVDNSIWKAGNPTPAAAPAYNPLNNPGAELHAPPPGGPQSAPPGPTNGVSTTPPPAGGSPNGYVPNYWEQQEAKPAAAPTTSAPLQQQNMIVNLLRKFGVNQ